MKVFVSKDRTEKTTDRFLAFAWNKYEFFLIDKIINWFLGYTK